MVAKGLLKPNKRSVMDEIIIKEIEQIKSKYVGYDRKIALATEPLCYYAEYYKQFKSTYHVQGQLESVLMKGKGIPSVGIPVEAMFLAEIKNLLLTAGHDLDLIQGELTVNVADEPLRYQGLAQKEQQLAKNDLYLSDAKGILSSIIYGPDFRTRITETTQNVVYFSYGVEGVTKPQLQTHLNTIASYLTQAINDVEIKSIEIF